MSILCIKMKGEGSEVIIKFLYLYAVRTCLWDYNDANFKNKVKCAIALDFILNELNIDGMTVEKLKNKIHSISIRIKFSQAKN